MGLDLDVVSSLSRPGQFGENQVSRTGIEPLLRRLERDEFDLVAVGRALLADPEWPRQHRRGPGPPGPGHRGAPEPQAPRGGVAPQGPALAPGADQLPFRP